MIVLVVGWRLERNITGNDGVRCVFSLHVVVVEACYCNFLFLSMWASHGNRCCKMVMGAQKCAVTLLVSCIYLTYLPYLGTYLVLSEQQSSITVRAPNSRIPWSCGLNWLVPYHTSGCNTSM